MFDCLRRHLNIDVSPELNISFVVRNGEFAIDHINDVYVASPIDASASLPPLPSKTFIPLGMAYGTSMHHQGAIIFDDKKIIIYEPYGTYRKMIKNKYYDYYEPLKKLFENRGEVCRFHADSGKQFTLLREGEKKYDSFIHEFKAAAAELLKKDGEKYSQLLKNLQDIDTSSESSKLAYLPEIMRIFVRDCEHLPLFINLYEKYSPYSCVAITAIEMYEFYTKKNIWTKITIADSWIAIEELCNLIVPKFVNFVKNTKDCQLLNIRVENIYDQ
jgi:hypothetical protein